MSDHTPGPWKWFDYPDGRKLLAAPSRAVIHCADAPMTVDRADMSLIAAAPDLLRAAKLIASFAQSWQPLTNGDIKELADAIAKAEEKADAP
jgi:hypothetical protein